MDKDLSEPKMLISNKFHRYQWKIKVTNPEKFKRALIKYRTKNPDKNIYSEDIRIMGSVAKVIFAILAIIPTIAFVVEYFLYSST